MGIISNFNPLRGNFPLLLSSACLRHYALLPVLTDICMTYRSTGFNCDNLIIANAIFFGRSQKLERNMRYTVRICTITQLLNTQYAFKTRKRNDFTTQLKPVLRYDILKKSTTSRRRETGLWLCWRNQNENKQAPGGPRLYHRQHMGYAP